MPNLQGISGFFCAGFFEKSRCFSLCFEGLGLVDIDPRHQPVKLPPGKIPDLRLLPGPLIAAADRQPFVDQNEAVRFAEQGFDPVPSSSTEKKESTGRRIHLELVFDVSVRRFSPFRVGLKTPILVNLKSPMHHVCY